MTILRMRGVWCLLAIFIMINITTTANELGINRVSQNRVWTYHLSGAAELQEGLAGSFTGLQNGRLIMAGGTAFPNGKPWEGGAKYFSDVITVLERDTNGEWQMVYQSHDMPMAVGEGASVSLPGGLVCIGGQTGDGHSRSVFMLSFDGMKPVVTSLPDLPQALRSSSASAIGNRIYVAGGESPDGPSEGFWMMDMTRQDAGWQRLTSLPVALSGASLVAQMDGEEVALFLFGGRARHASEPLTTFYSAVYHYRPSTGNWIEKKVMQDGNGNPLPLAMATAVPIGASHVLLAGGDEGTVFNQVEAAINAISKGDEGATARRDSLWINHSGFFDRLLVYNTVTDSWFDAGALSNPVAVATAVSRGNTVWITGGEERPGIRSAFVQEITLSVQTGFGWVNYLVLGVYFIGMLMLGFYFMSRENDTNDFFKAGGRIPWWAAGISIFATTLSAITFIAIPAKTYAADWRMLVFNLTIILIAPVVIRFFLPFFRRFNFDTAYQYLEMRFNRVVRWLASLLFIFFMVSRIAIVLFLPSLALHAVTGFNVYFAIIIMGVVTIVYCTSGGIEAVVWGDVIQGFILVGGALVAFFYMMSGIDGGIGTFWTNAMDNDKFRTFDFRFDFTQPVFWVVLTGGLANTLISYTSDQSVVQRYMTTRDEKATARSIWLNGFLSIPVSLLFFLLGTGLYAFYIANPAQLGVVNPNIDSVFPQFIVSEMPSGVAGILIAAIFAAAMSTLSSNINSVSAVVTNDFYKTLSSRVEPHKSMQVARWSGILIGVLGIGMALILATWNIASLWDQFNTFLGLLTGGLGALFIMGIFFKRIGGVAALIGVAAGLIVLIVVKNHTSLSFLMYGFVGMFSSVAIGWLLSFIFPNKKELGAFTWRSIAKG